MNKPTPTSLVVLSTTQLTPNMQRIVLQGDGLSRFPTDCAGGYIKLLFTPEGGTDLSVLDDNARPVMRTYTIREIDHQSATVTVDFVRHQVNDTSCGHAARWAMQAKPGDTINIAGPGTIQNLNTDADWFFLTADMTALPALSVKLASLPENARGYAVIEIQDKDDIQALEGPAGVTLDWVIADTKTNRFVEKVKAKNWLAGNASVWCACEFESMRALRQYFRNEHGVDREFIYISSYWKNGVTEEGHKVIKREDAKATA
ncbi:SIP domain-containing protein [Vibrio sp. V39_P1S14PM300]|nr:siderophore-interacting protein [Vibrio sp. V39_P1S14PM300]NAX22053.1 SIP domain-containing protein [Vibrio sp. V39_P1S14PM300]